MLITSIDVALGPKYLNEPKVGLFMGSISTANNSLRPFRALQPTLILSLSLRRRPAHQWIPAGGCGGHGVAVRPAHLHFLSFLGNQIDLAATWIHDFLLVE
jgi:hypothetical protein